MLGWMLASAIFAGIGLAALGLMFVFDSLISADMARRMLRVTLVALVLISIVSTLVMSEAAIAATPTIQIEEAL